LLARPVQIRNQIVTNPNPYLHSLEDDILSGDPVHLVLLLLRGARQAVEQARRCLRDGQVRERAAEISRAVERIGELYRTLDFKRGGEIATNLGALYDYMIQRLNEANMRQAEAPLSEVSELLVPLIEAWSELESAALTVDAPVGSERHQAMNLCA